MLSARGIRNIHGHRGDSLIEVLVTMVILAFGLLGMAGIQGKTQVTEMESYQREQGVLLLGDMIDRIKANAGTATNYGASYVTGAASPLGTSDAQPPSCTSLTVGSVARDQCEWSNALKGAAQMQQNGSNQTPVGAMIGARGCIELIQSPNPASGVCTPGKYRVSVTWQGMGTSNVPSTLTCGNGQYSGAQRIISGTVVIGIPSCS